MNNSILRFAKVTIRVLQILILIFIVLLALGALSPILGFDLLAMLSPSIDSEGITFSTKNYPSKSSEDLNAWFLEFIFVKRLLQMILVFLILRIGSRMIASIQNLQTFTSSNISNFKRMGFLFLLALLISIPDLKPNGDGFEMSLTIGLGYGIASLACYLLAEIFKEGNRLLEDSKLMI